MSNVEEQHEIQFKIVKTTQHNNNTVQNNLQNSKNDLACA